MKTAITRATVADFAKLLLHFHCEWFGTDAWDKLKVCPDDPKAFWEFSCLGLYAVMRYVEGNFGKHAEQVLSEFFEAHSSFLRTGGLSPSQDDALTDVTGTRFGEYDRALNSKDPMNTFITAIGTNLRLDYLDASLIFQYWGDSAHALGAMRKELDVVFSD